MATTLQRRPDLLVKPFGDDGQHVVKDPITGEYFNLPPQEAFLLNQLDGTKTPEAICDAFKERFGEPLTAEDLDGFVGMAREQRLLVADNETAVQAPAPKPWRFRPLKLLRKLLYWRRSLFDPDTLLNRLEPPLRFIWTKGFFWVSLSVIVLATVLQFSHWREYADYLPETLRWETVVLAWVILFVVTMIHEFSHGLTCKHHGGEVHEIGFLMMFFIPCFYCNVSDAWLIKEKSKRVWVTLAGGYCDLCLWALAVVCWRVTLPGTFPNHVAWIIVTICGGRIFFNFNPLIKLDGYYIFSDLVDIPNLRQRSLDYVAGWLRWLLWGADRPEPTPRWAMMFGFGVVSWSFTLFYLCLAYYALYHLFLSKVGVVGILGVATLMYMIFPVLFGPLFAGEVTKMWKYRPTRKIIWLSILGLVAAFMFLWPVEDSASATFKTRATSRAEIRAPVNGFLRAAHCDEGSQVSTGALLVEFEVPDLGSKLAQKSAEETEVQSRLKLLLAGARPEEVAEVKLKVSRAKSWRDLASIELERKQSAHKEALESIEQQIALAKVQVEYARNALDRASGLLAKKALPLDRYNEAQQNLAVAQTQLAQAMIQKRERTILGTLEAEAELARREKDHADAQASLRLLEAGTRPEEIDAEKARLARIREEKTYLEHLKGKLNVLSPLKGIIVTPHVKEKIGQYLKEGDLICELEDPASMEIEIPLEEHDIHRIEPGCVVELKPRALPFHTLKAKIKYSSPLAVAGKVQSTVNVNCHLCEPSTELISGMTGYARIYTGRTSPAGYVWHRFVRYLRTEIWW